MSPAEWFFIGAIVVGAAEHIIAVSPLKENSTIGLIITGPQAHLPPKQLRNNHGHP